MTADGLGPEPRCEGIYFSGEICRKILHAALSDQAEHNVLVIGLKFLANLLTIFRWLSMKILIALPKIVVAFTDMLTCLMPSQTRSTLNTNSSGNGLVVLLIPNILIQAL